MHYTRLGKHTVNAVRLAEVAQVLVRYGFADLLRRAGFQDGTPAKVLRGLNLMHQPKGEPATFGQRLRDALVELGPTYIKLGQILSTRPDLIGYRLADELTWLQDKVSPKPFDLMAEMIASELKQPIDKVFASFDKEPIASASLSQVYHATLPTGEEVAVKVQRPGIERTIDSDLSLMRQIAEWIEGVEDFRWFHPAGIVEEFARSIRRELDFFIEASVIDQFHQNFAEDPDVFIPHVHSTHSSKRVLTMDWVDGMRVDKLDEYPGRNSDPKVVSRRGCEVLCKMVFEHHLFHADPHPANLFIMRDNVIAFIDLGMAGHLDKGDVATIADLLHAIFQQDLPACVEAVLLLSPNEPPDSMNTFESELGEFIAFEAKSIVSGGQVARGIERAVEILRRYDLELSPRFSLLLKALATIENVGRKLDPDMDMVPILQPYLEETIRARYHPATLAREAQDNTLAMMRLGRRLPSDASYLLQQMRRGRIRFQLHHEHLENLAATIDQASSRLTVGMIIAGIVVGSSLLITVEGAIGQLGMGGFIFAGVLGFVLIINILWSRKF